MSASVQRYEVKNKVNDRYSGIAVGLHWLIALLIIGMLAVGKFMTSLDESDSLRFELTQWHKSFGITILVFSLFRLYWRSTHHPPPLPQTTRTWEKVAAGATHFLLYFLLISLPVTGWIMVSASPLNISTLLFQVIPFPHIPVLPDLANKAEVAELFGEVHEIASGVLIVLLILHIGAALKHHFVHRDGIMQRMSPAFGSAATKDGLQLFAGLIVAFSLSLFLFNSAKNHTRNVSLASKSLTSSAFSSSSGAIRSQVTFTLVLMGADLTGQFMDSSVEISLDRDNLSDSSLRASVGTEGANTGDPQVDDALPNRDWFDVNNYPKATFTSTSMRPGNSDMILVAGNLTIRDTTVPIDFPITIDQNNRVSGGFTINRLDFSLGKVEQPDDSAAGFNVHVEFSFELTE